MSLTNLNQWSPKIAFVGFALVLFILSLHFTSFQVFAIDAVIEDGYSVTTVIDGHKLEINPHAVILKPGSSDLVVLDSSGSAFYTVPFPPSKDSVIKRLSGGGIGYIDGEPGSVRFNGPRSFAVDSKGNVYVADQNNKVIRKITNSGVTSTIAGVYDKTGRDDGPAQNATFSNSFELVFVAERCALLVSDRGNQLVRQIDLKAEDCRRDSGSGRGVLSDSIWGAVVGAALLIGFVVGFSTRPFVSTREGARIGRFHETWRLCLINLGKLVPTLCFVIRSAIANLSLVCSLLERLFFTSLSHISLVFSVDNLIVAPRVSWNEQPSLLDSHEIVSSSTSISNSEMPMISEKYVYQLKDLMTFDGGAELTSPVITDAGDNVDLVDFNGEGRLDNMMKTNVLHFAGVTKETSNLVRRR